MILLPNEGKKPRRNTEKICRYDNITAISNHKFRGGIKEAIKHGKQSTKIGSLFGERIETHHNLSLPGNNNTTEIEVANIYQA